MDQVSIMQLYYSQISLMQLYYSNNVFHLQPLVCCPNPYGLRGINYIGWMLLLYFYLFTFILFIVLK